MIRTSGQVQKYYEILEFLLGHYDKEQQQSGQIGFCNRLHEELVGVPFQGVPNISSIPYFPSTNGYIECMDVTSYREGSTLHSGDILLESFVNQYKKYSRIVHATGHISDKIKMLVLFCTDCNLMLEGVDDYGYVYYRHYDALLDYNLLKVLYDLWLHNMWLKDILLLHQRTISINDKDDLLYHDYIDMPLLWRDVDIAKDSNFKVVSADIVFSDTNVEVN